MPVLPQVIAVRRRYPHLTDLPLIGEKAQIAVHRAPADLIILSAHVQIDLVGSGMVTAGLHRLQHQLPLL